MHHLNNIVCHLVLYQNNSVLDDKELKHGTETRKLLPSANSEEVTPARYRPGQVDMVRICDAIAAG